MEDRSTVMFVLTRQGRSHVRTQEDKSECVCVCARVFVHESDECDDTKRRRRRAEVHTLMSKSTFQFGGDQHIWPRCFFGLQTLLLFVLGENSPSQPASVFR